MIATRSVTEQKIKPMLNPAPPRPDRSLCLSVTGHRSQSDRHINAEAVQASLGRVINDLMSWTSNWKSSVYSKKNPEIRLMSALADGPDQWMVEAFSELAPEYALSYRLEAIIPFETGHYAETFSHEAERERFLHQFSQANAKLVLADWAPSKGVRSHESITRHWVDQRYRTLGRILTTHADLLIAVWDGKPSRGPGGTTEVIDLAFKKAIPIIWIHSLTGDIHWIGGDELRRNAPSEPKHASIQGEDLFIHLDHFRHPYQFDRIDDILDRVKNNTRHISGEISPLRDGPEAYFEKEKVKLHTHMTLYDWLLERPSRTAVLKSQGISPAPKSQFRLTTQHIEMGPLAALREWEAAQDKDQKPNGVQQSLFGKGWAAADSIATRLGHHYRSTYLAIFGLAALATFIGLLGLPLATTPSQERGFAISEIALVLGALIVFWHSKTSHIHRRWLNAREISEQLRAQWALTLIGLGGRLDPPRGQSWTTWLTDAYINKVGIVDLRLDPHRMSQYIRFILDHIIDDQINYHNGNQRHLQHIHRRLESLGTIAFGLALLSSFGLTSVLSFESFSSRLSAEHFEKLVHSLQALCAALPALGAAVTGIRFQGEFERFAHRSGQSHAALLRLKDQFNDLFTHCEMHKETPSTTPIFESLWILLERLEHLIVNDLNDWRLVYESRPSPGLG